MKRAKGKDIPDTSLQEIIDHEMKGRETLACEHVADNPACASDPPYRLTLNMDDGRVVVAVLCVACVNSTKYGGDVQLKPVVASLPETH